MNDARYLIIITYETVSTVKYDDICLDMDWFLLIVLVLEAVSDAVPYHVMVGFLQLDRHAPELDEDSPRPLAVGLSPSLVPQLD